MTFKYDKDNLFKEFEVAKQKDFKLSKKQKQDDIENDYFTNRIQYMKDHIELKKTNPNYYEYVDINFDNLLKAYESVNPRDYFYITVFGKTYSQKKREEEFAQPDYDHHMYDLPDEHTIESQECDSVPVRSIPDCGSHSCHPEVYGPSRCKEESNDCNDDTSTICTEESTTQRDTFILRVPKNKKCRIKTDE